MYKVIFILFHNNSCIYAHKMLPFIHPFTMIIAGPSSCGKTTFVSNLIRQSKKLLHPNISKILWCSPESTSLPKNLNFLNIDFYKSIPETIENEDNENLLLVLDDLMIDVYNKQVCELFTKGSHHRNLSIILLIQNIFHQGKFCRDISLNAKYIVLFKNPRDMSQILPLARQIFPQNVREFVKVYNEVTLPAHGYIVLDLTQNGNNLFRIRSNIFEKNFCVTYCTTNDLNNKDNCQSYETIKEKPTYITNIKKF